VSDPFYYVDGELDDVSPEERRALAAEAAAEWQADELANEAEDAAREERGSDTPERRA
jgi:hypothetical protein